MTGGCKFEVYHMYHPTFLKVRDAHSSGLPKHLSLPLHPSQNVYCTHT